MNAASSATAPREVSRRPEERLLLECVRRRVGPPDHATLNGLVGSALDWPYLLRMATRHQVLPLLHGALVDAEAAGASVPALASVAARQALDTRIERNRRLAAELVRLLRLAADAGLAWLPFKGPVLAMAVYGDLALRQYADLDVLVDAAQSAATEEFLETLGYRRDSEFDWAAHFVHRETKLCVDLHRGGLTPDAYPIRMVVARLWARRESVWLEGTRVETLSTEDLLVVLCIQAARDAWQGKTRLGKICDIAHVLKASTRLDWTRVEAEARALHVRRVLEFGLRLAERITQVPSRCPFLGTPHRGLVALVGQEERALFDDPTAPPVRRMRGHLAHLHLRERWRDKLWPYRTRALALMSPTQMDRDAVPLPAALSWLHYLIRPLLLIGRYGPYLFRGRLD